MHGHASERLKVLVEKQNEQREHDAWVASEIQRLEALNKQTDREVLRLERRVRKLYGE